MAFLMYTHYHYYSFMQYLKPHFESEEATVINTIL